MAVGLSSSRSPRSHVLQHGRRAKAAEAQQYLGSILTEYELGNYQAALDGTDAAPGLLDLADDYGSTPTGDQARFFAADAYLQLGQPDEALAMFEAYDGDGILGASALAGQASIQAGTRGEHAEAAALYVQACRESTPPTRPRRATSSTPRAPTPRPETTPRRLPRSRRSSTTSATRPK